MSTRASTVFYFLVMVALIVAMDIVFFRHRFLARLIANITVVAVFCVIYLAFVKHR